jgi:hypothetical protein
MLAKNGDDHDVGGRVAAGRLADQIDAAAIGQPQIGEQHIGRLVLERAPRRRQVTDGGQQRQLLGLRDDAAEAGQEGRVVLHHHHGCCCHRQAPSAGMCRDGSHRWPAPTSRVPVMSG